jgi:tetratricopeptide (TPR) repeat protein
MRGWLFVFLLAGSVGTWGQSSSPSSTSPTSPADPPPSSSAPANSRTSNSPSAPTSKPAPPAPNLAPPRSDRVNADELGDAPGESSSKDTPLDLSPPPGDAKAHPDSSDILTDEAPPSSSSDVTEVHPWNPHKAAKDIEVGDFYFKRKNYRAAEDRYREALLYKDNDATATFRLAVCLEKLNQPDEASREYENYLKIMPHGPDAGKAEKAIQRLKGTTASAQAP